MTRREGAGAAGFTLVETLAALVIVAVTVVVVQRGLVAARVGLGRADAVVAAERVARGLVETRLNEVASGPGTRDGRTDGLDWRVIAEPLDLPFPPPRPPAGETPAAAGGAAVGLEPQGRVGGRSPPAGEEAAPAAPQVVWRPLRVTVRVEARPGRPVSIETVHLVRAQPAGTPLR